MQKETFARLLRLMGGMAICSVALVVLAQALAKETVRAELIRLQKQTGLSLVSFGGGGGNGHLDVVVLDNRHLTAKQLLQENVGDGEVSSGVSKIAFDVRRT